MPSAEQRQQHRDRLRHRATQCLYCGFALVVLGAIDDYFIQTGVLQLVFFFLALVAFGLAWRIADRRFESRLREPLLATAQTSTEVFLSLCSARSVWGIQCYWHEPITEKRLKAECPLLDSDSRLITLSLEGGQVVFFFESRAEWQSAQALLPLEPERLRFVFGAPRGDELQIATGTRGAFWCPEGSLAAQLLDRPLPSFDADGGPS